MHPTLARSQRFEDLLGLAQNDTPYSFDTIFRNDGFMARRLSKKKYRLLKRIDPRLRAILEPDERVRFLTVGAGLSFVESYFMGMFGHLLNYRALVLTDRRMLLVQIDWRERPKQLLEQIRWRTVDGIKRSIFGNLAVTLRDGTKRVFQGVPRADRKMLHELGDKMSDLMEPDIAGLETMCTHCFGVVDGHPERCATCGGAFKSARTAMVRSLLWPGLGDFYLGHWKFAIWESLVVAYVWANVAYLALDPMMTPGVLAVIVGFVWLFVHVPDAILTRYIARKGLYPKGGTIGSRVAMRKRREGVAAGVPAAGLQA